MRILQIRDENVPQVMKGSDYYRMTKRKQKMFYVSPCILTITNFTQNETFGRYMINEMLDCLYLDYDTSIYQAYQPVIACPSVTPRLPSRNNIDVPYTEM